MRFDSARRRIEKLKDALGTRSASYGEEQRLKEQGYHRWPWRTLAEAISYMHEHGDNEHDDAVVHEDIGPVEIVTDSGGWPWMKCGTDTQNG